MFVLGVFTPQVESTQLYYKKKKQENKREKKGGVFVYSLLIIGDS
jgi:hypothetical protein